MKIIVIACLLNIVFAKVILQDTTAISSGQALKLTLTNKQQQSYQLPFVLQDLKSVYFQAQVLDDKGQVDIEISLNSNPNFKIQTIPFLKYSSEIQTIARFNQDILKSFQSWEQSQNSNTNDFTGLIITIKPLVDCSILLTPMIVKNTALSYVSSIFKLKANEQFSYNLYPELSADEISSEVVQQYNLLPDFVPDKKLAYAFSVAYDPRYTLVLVKNKIYTGEPDFPVLNEDVKLQIKAQKVSQELQTQLETFVMFGEDLQRMAFSIFVISKKKLYQGPIQVSIIELKNSKAITTEEQQRFSIPATKNQRFYSIKLSQSTPADEISVQIDDPSVVFQVCQVNQSCLNSFKREKITQLQQQSDIVLLFFTENSSPFDISFRSFNDPVSPKKGLETWMIIVISAGCFVGGLLLGVLIYYCIRKSQDAKKGNPSAYSEEITGKGYLQHV